MFLLLEDLTEISFQTVLDAVNRQRQEIEAKVDAKIS
jgi:hypothetical protein